MSHSWWERLKPKRLKAYLDEIDFTASLPLAGTDLWETCLLLFPSSLPSPSPPTSWSLEMKKPFPSVGLSQSGHLQGHSLILVQGQVERRRLIRGCRSRWHNVLAVHLQRLYHPSSETPSFPRPFIHLKSSMAKQQKTTNGSCNHCCECATHSDVKPLLAHEHMGRRLEQKKNWWWALLSIPPFAGQMPMQIEDYNSSPSFLTKGFFNSKFDKAQICSHSFSVCWRVWKGTHSLHFGLVLPLP